jgi:lipoprotein-releasing system permease protein
MWTEWTIALKFLQERSLQTALILTGIAVGVAVIVFLTALSAGLQANTIERTLGTQAHVRVLPPYEANVILPAAAGTTHLVREDKRAQRLRSINNWLIARDLLDAVPRVRAVSPVVSGPAFARRGEAQESVAIIGIDVPRYLRLVPLADSLVAGELRVGAGNAVIGVLLAEALGARVGDKLRLNAGTDTDTILDVAGISSLGVRELDSRYVYLDLKQAQSLLDLPGGVTVIDVTVDDIFAAEDVARRIARLTGLEAESWMETNAQLLNALSAQGLSANLISVFVALSVAFGIASVLSVSIVQRTREIGILRAMGTTRRQMLVVFLVQGALFGFGGAALGSGIGYGLVALFNTFGPGLFFIPITANLVVGAILVAAITGVLAAVVPAERAARLDPVEAIRHA